MREDLLQHYPFCFFLAEKYSKNDPSLLPDLIHEAWMGMVKAEERFDENKGTKFITYASYWMKVTMQRFLKQWEKREQVLNDDHEYLLHQKAEVGYVPTPDEAVERQEIIEKVRLAISQLPEKDVIILREYFWDCKPLTQMARERKVSVEAVRQRLHRILGKVRRFLEKEIDYDSPKEKFSLYDYHVLRDL